MNKEYDIENTKFENLKTSQRSLLLLLFFEEACSDTKFRKSNFNLTVQPVLL